MLILLCFFTKPAECQTSQFQNLQEQRNAAIQRVIAPINDKYVAELESLLKSSIAAGELDEAVKIREQLQLFKIPSNEVPPSNPVASKTFSERSLIGTKWTFVEFDGTLMRTDFSKELFEIYKLNEKGEWNKIGGNWRWEVLSESDRTLKIFWKAGEEVVKLSENLKEIEGSKKDWKQIE